MGILAASGRLGAASAQFVNGTLESNIPLLLFVTSACTIVGGVASWLLPKDPAGNSLPGENGEHDDSGSEVPRKESSKNSIVYSPLYSGSS